MQLQLRRRVRHAQGVQAPAAQSEKVLLMAGDEHAAAQQRGAPLMDGAKHVVCLLQLALQVLPYLRVIGGVVQLPVEAADAELRPGDTALIADVHAVLLRHEDVRQDMGGALRPAELAARIGIQLAYLCQCAAHLLLWDAQRGGDGPEPAAAQRLQIFADNGDGGTLVPQPLQLQQQALGQVAGADTRRLQPPQPRHAEGHLLLWRGKTFRQLRIGKAHVAVVIQTVAEVAQQCLVRPAHRQVGDLPPQKQWQRFPQAAVGANAIHRRESLLLRHVCGAARAGADVLQPMETALQIVGGVGKRLLRRRCLQIYHGVFLRQRVETAQQVNPAHLQDLQTLELPCRELLLLLDLYLQNAASFPVDLTDSIAQKRRGGKSSEQHGHAEAATGVSGSRFCV